VRTLHERSISEEWARQGEMNVELHGSSEHTVGYTVCKMWPAGQP
jgi:hypothetical protein